MELKIKALSPKLGKEIPFPAYATPGSAGPFQCAASGGNSSNSFLTFHF